jgi:hypothetical protein
VLLALAALSTPLVGGPAGGWPRPLVLPRAAVSSHSSSEPSALSHGVGRGGGAVRRRSWSSENRAVRWSPSGCRAVTSRAPRRATFPHFLAWRGNGSSSPGREKGGRPIEVRGALEVRGAPEVRGARVLSRDCPPRPGAPGRGAPLREVPAREAPSTERPPEGRALEGRALEGRLGEPDGRPEALERGDAGLADGRADPPERADAGLADGRADVLERGDDALAAPLVPDVRDVRAEGAPGRADLVDPAGRSVRLLVLRAGRLPLLGSSSSACQLAAARRGAAPLVRALGAPGLPFPPAFLPPAPPPVPDPLRAEGARREG